MADETQALASLRFVSRWGVLLIGVPALVAATAVGYIVADAARDGYSQVIAASACAVAGTVLDESDMDAAVPPHQNARLDAVVQARHDAASFHGMRLANSEGLVVYSTNEEETGCCLKKCADSQRVQEADEVYSEIVPASDLAPNSGELIKVCAPLHLDGGEDVEGVVVAVQPYADVAPAIHRAVHASVVTVLGAAPFAFLGLQLVVRRSIGQIEGERENTARLNARLAASSSEMEEQALGTFQALMAAVDAKDSYTATHSIMVAELALAINVHMQSPADAMHLEQAALLHDIGKIGVSEIILSKPQRLDRNDWASMRDHPGSGAEILAAVPFMAGIVDIIRHHHERWDGNGYPDQLAGEEIPVESRILALADSYDAMTTERPYSPAMTPGQAREEVIRCSGTQFDPAVVEAFLEAFEVQGIRWWSRERLT